MTSVSTSKAAIPQAFLPIVENNEHLRDQELAPERYEAAATSEVRSDILAMLETMKLLYCACVDAEGWPVGFVAPFVFAVGENNRPILYMRLPKESAELKAIGTNPRISAATYLATGFERRREAKGLQLQALASIVSDNEAQAELAALPDQPSFRPEPIEDGVTVRIDPLAAVFFHASYKPQWGFLDYVVSD